MYDNCDNFVWNLLKFCIIMVGCCWTEARVFNCHTTHKEVCQFKYRTIESNDVVMFNAQNTYKNRAIRQVKFLYSTLFFVPADLFRAFDNLEKLWIDGQDLQELRPRTFAQAKRLNFLDLGSNKFEVIEDDVFEGAYNLKWLDLCCGELREINKNAFDGLISMEHIILCSNKIKSIHKDTFKELVYLKEIDLLGNQLEFLHKDLFINNHDLLEIYLNKNKIATMSNTMFSHLTKLNGLMVSGNQCVDKNFNSRAKHQFETVEHDLANCAINYTSKQEIVENYERFKILSKRTSLISDNSLSDSTK